MTNRFQFTKYLSLKAVQAVVQSRLGEKSNAPSIPDTSEGTSWYNLAIKDIPEVRRIESRFLRKKKNRNLIRKPISMSC